MFKITAALLCAASTLASALHGENSHESGRHLQALQPVNEGTYLKQIRQKAEAVLRHNLNAANRAKLRADTYYNQPVYDPYTHTWDYTGKPTSLAKRTE